MAKITTDFLVSQVNGIVVNKAYLANSNNFLNKASREVYYVVMHYTGNSDDTALANVKYFKNNITKTSAHFFVDETSIYQSVELRDVAWHCGSTKGYKTGCRNSNSFGIEMTTAGNYTVSKQTQINSAYLCAELCKMIGIAANEVDTYVLRHYDVNYSNKACPKQYVQNSAEWTQFKTWVKNILNTGNHEGKTVTPAAPKGNAIVEKGQKHAIEFTGVQIAVDGKVGPETRAMKARVLQHAMNLDYKKNPIVEDGKFGSKSKAKLGTHYVKKGERQYMVTAAEILMELNGIDPNGVEYPGHYGNGLTKATAQYFNNAGTRISASDFLKLIK